MKADVTDNIHNLTNICLLTAFVNYAAKALVEVGGATEVYACATHGVLSGPALERIEESPIELVISTDTVENPFVAESPKMITVSAAPLFAEAVSRIHDRVSVSPLFEKVPAKVLADSEK